MAIRSCQCRNDDATWISTFFFVDYRALLTQLPGTVKDVRSEFFQSQDLPVLEHWQTPSFNGDFPTVKTSFAQPG